MIILFYYNRKVSVKKGDTYMEVLSLIFFALLAILSIVTILLLGENSDKENVKYYDKDSYYDSNLEKHRKIIKVQKKMILKKKVNLY